MTRVLAVDDSALMRKLLGQLFAAAGGFVFEAASNGAEALAKLGAFRPHVITLDVTMPGMSGLAVLDRIMIEHPCPVVMVSALTAQGAEETLAALELGAVDFVPKPRGTISLHLDEFGPLLIEKVRMAAAVGIRKSRRLSERLRFRTELAPASTTRLPSPALARPALNESGLVVVGCSTGGPPALEALLSSIPSGFPWPLVIAQHMPRTFTGALARRLDGICEIAVHEVTAPVGLAAGTAYIGRGDADLIVVRRAGKLHALAAPSDAAYPWHPSTDRLVTSALGCMPASHLIGVLMTGMGRDGASAMAELRARGGRTIAESRETAVVWGMPGALVELGGADAILPLDRIGAQIREWVP